MRTRRLCQPLVGFVATWVATALSAGPAFSFDLEVQHSGPSVVGESHAFTAAPVGASGTVTYEWRFGESAESEPGGATTPHSFTAPGLYSISVDATDSTGDTGSAFFQHLVHHPLTPQRPTSASPIIYDKARNRIYSANQDNDTVTFIDPDSLTKVGEVAVFRRPESLALTPKGKLWVVNQEDYAVAVVDPDRLVMEGGFRLPYASQPVGVAMSPTGDAAYVSLMGLGKLLKLDPNTGAVLGEVALGSRPRGIAVSFDGKDVYVSRFISPNTGGEVVKVDAATMTVATRIVLKLDTETEDNDQRSRGLPNYLFSVALSADGRQAWVPGKKDNVVRGKLIDGQEITHDTTVRPLAAVIDVQKAAEIFENRVDLDDRSMPVHVEFSPFGNFAILTLAGSNRVEVRDVNKPTKVFSAIGEVGSFPRASVLTPNQRLFVQAALSRNVLVYDMTPLLKDFDGSTPKQLADIPAVANDKVPPQVLSGKKIFHDAEDMRMSNEGYLSCGACHFEGLDDGRVYDFSGRGEGLRNTISLIGHKGASQGRLNWTGTLDEIQDFEHQIRTLFAGNGFMPDDVFHVGMRDQPLGDPKAGVTAELDALAAYVSSLDHTSPSPFRNPDGSLTADGVAGKALFKKLGCDFCHSGAQFTDSARGLLHDVGTITPLSGQRAGALLTGIDTPTLLGVWETPPYLHDGSAATLRDVLTTKNVKDEHGFVSALSPQQVDQLVAYVQQIDGEEPVRRLPFEPPVTASGGASGSGGAVASGGGGAAGSAVGGTSSTSGGTGAGTPATSGGSAAMTPANGGPLEGCNCRVTPRARTGANELPTAWVGTLLASALWGLRRRRRGLRAVHLASAALALALFGIGCSPAQPTPSGMTPAHTGGQVTTGGQSASGGAAQGGQAGSGPSVPDDWSALPNLSKPDPELFLLGLRQATIDRLCARARGDAFARALCGGPRPNLHSVGDLLQLAGLDRERAFALTGNSTSLVAKSVSAINPRVIVFPRVEPGAERPQTMTAIGFVRGEQFAEVVSRDAAGDYNFYLVGFEQKCSYTAEGCDLASLLTEEIESNWTAYSVYDQDDLEPTTLDCLSCHRPGGRGTKRILRMQELSNPWMHWFPQRFVQRSDSDRMLLAQFAEAHKFDKQYGGIPVSTISGALEEGSAAQLEALIRAEGSGDQPNPFDAQIAVELKSGASATWQARYSAHLSGQAIAVPFPGVDVTDEAKRSAAVRSYQDVVQGAAPRSTLLDIRDVFSADANEKLSFVPKASADGKTVLLQMCARCHDGRSEPQYNKSRFNVLKLAEMNRAEKDVAIERLNGKGNVMPPSRAGVLTAEGRQAAIAELQR